MPKIKFAKLQGLGNDFILLDERNQEPLNRRTKGPEVLAELLCRRRLGIGADGLIVLLPSKTADWRMRIYNPDGSEAEMCGNGIRCLVCYLLEEELVGQPEIKIETGAGIIKTKLREGLIEVDMGEPILEAGQIPVRLPGQVILHPLEVDGYPLQITCVSMGNPHCVIFVEDVTAAPLTRLGPKLERHPLFPRRTNVEFVQILETNRLKMRVWERGAGETPACGTGACAAVVAAGLAGKADRRSDVELPGGLLSIVWTPHDNHVYMTGPAQLVFRGEIDME